MLRPGPISRVPTFRQIAGARPRAAMTRALGLALATLAVCQTAWGQTSYYRPAPQARPGAARGQSPDPYAPRYGQPSSGGQVPLGRTGPTSAPSYSPAPSGGYGGVQTQYAPQGRAPATTTSRMQPGSYQPPRNTDPFANDGSVFSPPPSTPPIDGAGQPRPRVVGGAQPGGYDDSGELFPQDVNGPFLDGDQPPPQFTMDPEVDINSIVTETQTGKLMFGVGVNSNAGVVGNIVLDEQNFDWRRWPRSWEDVRSGRALRGGGQQFRIEAMPGTQVSRYSFNFREPYLADTMVNFGLSGFYFQRFYRDWTEQRLGGRVSLGYQFTPDLSGAIALRGEDVEISNPRLPAPEELLSVVGHNALYSAQFSLVHDTRDSAFLATEGHRVEAAFEQAFGSFSFPRATLSGRQYFMLHERPDTSGRHVLTLASDVGFSGSDTPIFENFFAGGFTTLRGFYFREASPRKMNVLVGGRFQWINSVEYMFPLTADDALRAVAFVDFGTVEQTTAVRGENFRVSPGVGLRITVPALGPAPIALDLAFPVAKADGDRVQNFSFFVGFGR